MIMLFVMEAVAVGLAGVYLALWQTLGYKRNRILVAALFIAMMPATPMLPIWLGVIARHNFDNGPTVYIIIALSLIATINLYAWGFCKLWTKAKYKTEENE